MLRLTDIAAVSKLGQAAGALVAVDNTFLSPGWQQPLELGADLVVHSTTKYINGHSDVVGGAVIAARKELHEQLCWWANCLGVTGSAFDSYLTLRGLRTLNARLAIHGRNALALAGWLAQQQPAGVEGVLSGSADASRARAGAASAVGVRRHRDASSSPAASRRSRRSSPG